MRILMVAPQPFFEPRGTPISIYQRLFGLSRLGHSVDLLTFPIGVEVEIPNVAVHRTISVPFIRKVKIGPSPAKLILDVFLFWKTFWFLLTRRYDAIHSHEEAAFFVMVLAALFNVPHVYDMHSSLPKQLQNFRFGNHWVFVKMFEWLEGVVLRTCNVALTIGADLEEHILRKNPTLNHIRIENIPISNLVSLGQAEEVNLREKYGLAGKKIVVYTGSFEAYQGLELLYDSAKIIVCEHPEVVFVLVGGSAEQIDEHKAQVNRMGLMDHFVFTGIVPLQDSLKYLDAADILVSPRTDGLSIPLKIYSYLFSGKPMVATDLYAHNQLLGAETAILTEPTPTAYAEGIKCLLRDPALCRKIGQQARAFAQERFSMEAYLSKLERAYTSVALCKPINELDSDVADNCSPLFIQEPQ